MEDDPKTGRRGRTGDAGRTGDTGRTGDIGDAGDTGIKGDPGTTGQQGDPGPPGKVGERGPRSNRALIVAVCVFAATAMLVAAVASTVSLIGQGDIKTIATRADKNGVTLARQQARLNRTVAALERAQKKLAGIDALCEVAVGARRALVAQYRQTLDFLENPEDYPAAFRELEPFVRAVSLPELVTRLATEKPPKACRRIVRKEKPSP